MGKRLSPVNAVEPTVSGRVGEYAAMKEFLRSGYSVAKPLDENTPIDILLFKNSGNLTISIPIQAKSTQFGQLKKAGKVYDKATYTIEGLLKRYVEQDFLLSLFVYRPVDNTMWFFPGAESIRKAYDLQQNRHRPKKGYTSLSLDSDVGLIFDVRTTKEFKRWKVPIRRNAAWLRKRIETLFASFWKYHDEIEGLSKLYLRT
jgi:hypothetical protein